MKLSVTDVGVHRTKPLIQSRIYLNMLSQMTIAQDKLLYLSLKTNRGLFTPENETNNNQLKSQPK